MSGTHGSTGDTSWTSPGAGITGGYNGHSQALKITIVFFAGLAMYNACELMVMVLLTFKHYRGLYFWSLLVAAFGIVPYALGFLLKLMKVTAGPSKWAAVTLLSIGWYPMVTGQALVLWSRLHLILHGKRGDTIIKWTKWMIIVDAICLHIPTTVLTFGSNGSVNTDTFVYGYNIMEKIQMSGFFCQEIILSSIYIIETVKTLRVSLRPNTRRTMQQLILINAIIIAMDLCLLGLEAASLYILETLVKGVIYSIKLKLEFAILGKLVNLIGGKRPEEDQNERQHSTGFVDPERKSTAIDHDMNVSEFVDRSKSDSSTTHAFRPEGASAMKNRGMEYGLARFAHAEDVTSLAHLGDSSSSLEIFYKV